MWLHFVRYVRALLHSLSQFAGGHVVGMMFSTEQSLISIVAGVASTPLLIRNLEYWLSQGLLTYVRVCRRFYSSSIRKSSVYCKCPSLKLEIVEEECIIGQPC